jgi:hypothetical protein
VGSHERNKLDGTGIIRKFQRNIPNDEGCQEPHRRMVVVALFSKHNGTLTNVSMSTRLPLVLAVLWLGDGTAITGQDVGELASVL